MAGYSPGVGCVGRPPVFVNLNIVELLRSVGYTWDEVSRALLVSRSTIWRKLRDAGITLDRYSNISDFTLDERVTELLVRHPHCGQVLLRSMLASQGLHVQLQGNTSFLGKDWRNLCGRAATAW